MTGLCNLSAGINYCVFFFLMRIFNTYILTYLDVTNAQIIVRLNGIESLGPHLWSEDEDILLDIIVTLTFFKLNVQQEDIQPRLESNLVERIKYLQRNNCSIRIRNVAKVFLEQCTSESSSYGETDNKQSGRGNEENNKGRG